jgi:DNA-binding transcriptional ArsR family regulator
MTTKVIMHVGTPKTGTTSIQKFLISQTDTLNRNGVFAVKSGRMLYGNHLLLPLRHPPDPEVYDQLRRELAVDERDVAVISSEHLYYGKEASLASLAEITSNYDREIVLYVRPQNRIIEETFLEWVKTNDQQYRNGIEGLFAAHRRQFLYAEKIDMLKSVFAAARFHVRAFLPEIRRVNLVEEFANLINVSGESTETQIFENPGLHPLLYPVVQELDRNQLRTENRQKLIAELSALSRHLKKTRDVSLITEEIQSKIIEFYEESNARLTDAWFAPDEAAAFDRIFRGVW